MKNDLLTTVKKDSIFTKIKNFILNIFRKKGIYSKSVDLVNSKNIIEDKNDFVEHIKLSQNTLNSIENKNEVEKIIKQLENDSAILENLSIDRLEKLNDYYDELIEEQKLKLKRLTAN